jgi:hypothetical protein
MQIVAFCGLAGSGKDTACKPLIEKGWIRIAFADKLKQVTSDVYGLPIEYMYDAELKEQELDQLDGKTSRFALQHVGTEGFRTVVANTWVNYVYRRLVKLNEQENKINSGWWRSKLVKMGVLKRYEFCVCINDLRFPNEAQALAKIGATIIYVTRPNIVAGSHASEALVAETGEQYAHLTLTNSGTKQDMWDKLHDYLNSNLYGLTTQVRLENFKPHKVNTMIYTAKEN